MRTSGLKLNWFRSFQYFDDITKNGSLQSSMPPLTHLPKSLFLLYQYFILFYFFSFFHFVFCSIWVYRLEIIISLKKVIYYNHIVIILVYFSIWIHPLLAKNVTINRIRNFSLLWHWKYKMIVKISKAVVGSSFNTHGKNAWKSTL